MRSFRRECGRRNRAGRGGGFSLPEVIVSIGIVGVMASVALVVYDGPVESSRAVMAGENTERLNGAVWNYSQIAREITVPGDPGDTDDEAAVIGLLQTRDAINMPGSPYLPSDLVFVTSDSADEFRIRWNGTVFEVIEPGVAGEGIVIQ